MSVCNTDGNNWFISWFSAGAIHPTPEVTPFILFHDEGMIQKIVKQITTQENLISRMGKEESNQDHHEAKAHDEDKSLEDIADRDSLALTLAGEGNKVDDSPPKKKRIKKKIQKQKKQGVTPATTTCRISELTRISSTTTTRTIEEPNDDETLCKKNDALQHMNSAKVCGKKNNTDDFVLDHMEQTKSPDSSTHPIEDDDECGAVSWTNVESNGPKYDERKSQSAEAAVQLESMRMFPSSNSNLHKPGAFRIPGIGRASSHLSSNGSSSRSNSSNYWGSSREERRDGRSCRSLDSQPRLSSPDVDDVEGQPEQFQSPQQSPPPQQQQPPDCPPPRQRSRFFPMVLSAHLIWEEPSRLGGKQRDGVCCGSCQRPWICWLILFAVLSAVGVSLGVTLSSSSSSSSSSHSDQGDNAIDGVGVGGGVGNKDMESTPSTMPPNPSTTTPAPSPSVSESLPKLYQLFSRQDDNDVSAFRHMALFPLQWAFYLGPQCKDWIMPTIQLSCEGEDLTIHVLENDGADNTNTTTTCQHIQNNTVECTGHPSLVPAVALDTILVAVCLDAHPEPRHMELSARVQSIQGEQCDGESSVNDEEGGFVVSTGLMMGHLDANMRYQATEINRDSNCRAPLNVVFLDPGTRAELVVEACGAMDQCDAARGYDNNQCHNVSTTEIELRNTMETLISVDDDRLENLTIAEMWEYVLFNLRVNHFGRRVQAASTCTIRPIRDDCLNP